MKKDTDFNNSEWFGYMKKFSGKYELGDADEELHLVSSCGQVKPYSIVKKELVFSLFEGHTKLKNKLKKNPYLRIVQEGDEEATFVFDQARLDSLASVLRLQRKKRHGK